MINQVCGCGGLTSTSRVPFVTEAARAHYARDRLLQVTRIKLDLRVDPVGKALEGVCTLQLRTLGPTVDHLELDAEALEVSSLQRDGREVPFSVLPARLSLRLDPPAQQGDELTLVIHYSARPARGMYFWPDQDDLGVQVWTQGQTEDSRCWFPSIDVPEQKAPTELSVTFPDGLTALSNGQLVTDEVLSDHRRRMHFRLDFAHAPYLMTLVIGRFEIIEAQSGPTVLRTFYPPGRRDDALRCVQQTPQMVSLFERWTGAPYPFGTYSQIFVRHFSLGGMENTSATTLSDSVLHDARAHLDYSAEWLIAHELAHQWFGDLLTCRDWAHAWLNEGFATYLEVLWLEESKGRDEADHQRKQHWDSYLHEATQRYERPVVSRKYDESMSLFDRHLYLKGAAVVHELRSRLGDSAFRAVLQRYVAKHRGGAVETVDLARAVTEVTGRNLDAFFETRIFEPGHPVLDIHLSYDPKRGGVSVQVKQDPKKHFELTLPLRIVTQTQVLTHALEITAADVGFFFETPGMPTQVLMDPAGDVLAVLKIDKAIAWWIAELASADEARARTTAAERLAREPTAQAVDALARGLTHDPFWAVRSACARSLGKIRTASAQQILRSQLKTHHPKVRRAVIAALGEFTRDPHVIPVLRQLCLEGDPSNFVEAEAARSLGKVKAPALLETLEGLLNRPSFQDVIACGAVDGLAASFTGEAFPLILSLAHQGRSRELRRAAILALPALGEAAARLRETADALGELLRDTDEKIQQPVLEAIRALGDPRLIGTVHAASLGHAHLRRTAKEVIRSLSSAPGSGNLGLRGELEALKQETAQLKTMVQALTAPQPINPLKSVTRRSPKTTKT